MCRLFQLSDPDSYTLLTRKIRIHGYSTSVRLERGFWAILHEMARGEGKSVGRLVTQLYNELRRTDTDLTNFASYLRVTALHYAIQYSSRFAPGQEGSAAVPLPERNPDE
jgi:predicted DNA-binding ribbon-helix-helix protein